MINVSHLTKKYGENLAVNDISFTIEQGHIYGLLGPNGAGKSTIMNIITGCLAPTEGSVSVAGHDILTEYKQAKSAIGYLPEIPPVYPDNTPLEYLSYVAEAKGLNKQQRDEQVLQVMEKTGIVEMRNRLIKNLSKGYRQRVGIAQAILGNPKIVILDEPTVGLDPKQIIEVRDLIKSLGQTHTVILSSHILSEIRAVCDQIIIIAKGNLIACDTLERIEELFESGSNIYLRVEGSPMAIEKVIHSVPGIDSSRIEKLSKAVAVHISSSRNSDEICKELSLALVQSGIPILQMSHETSSLEDVFIELTSLETADTQSKTEKERIDS